MKRVLLTLLAATVSLDAAAFVCTRVPGGGPSLAWQKRTVPFLIHETCSADVELQPCLAAVRSSFAAWTDVACSDFAFEDQGTTAERRSGYDWRHPEAAVNVVVFREGDPAQPLDAWTHQAGALAITTVTFNSRTGKILDADIEVNAAPNGSRQFVFQVCAAVGLDCLQNDIQNTLTHEAGHVLGMDHTPTTQANAAEATMFASAPQGEIKKRSLAADDEAAVCSVYPTGLANAPCFPADASANSTVKFKQTKACSDTSSSPCNTGCSGSQGLLSGLFVLGTGTLRRRRRGPAGS